MASFSDYLKENNLIKKIGDKKIAPDNEANFKAALAEEIDALGKNINAEIDKKTEAAIEETFVKESKARNELDEQICTIKKNIDLRIEELKCAKDYFKLYDYLYILISLRKAHDYLTEAQDTINGWLPVYEEELPKDEIFEGENNDED